MERDLIRRVEDDEVRGLTSFGQRFLRVHGSAGRGVLERPGWVVVALGPGMPINRAIGLGNAEQPSAGHVDEAVTYLSGLGLPAEIEVTDATSEALEPLLEPAGFRPGREFKWYVKSAGGPLPGASDGIVIDASPDAAEWVRVTALGFDGRDEGAPADVSRMLSETTASAGNYLVLASIGGEPAGGGAMAIQDGHAMLFSASTLPRFRRRGVQSALLASRMGIALERGCDLFSVKVEPGSDSERNMRRVGFRELCSKAVWALEG